MQRAGDWSASGTGERACQLRSGLTSHLRARACVCAPLVLTVPIIPRSSPPLSFLLSFFLSLSSIVCPPPFTLSSQLPKFGIKRCRLSTAYTLFMIFLGCSVASYYPLSYLHTAAVEEAHFSPSLNLQGCKTKPVQKWTAVPLTAT